MSKIKDKLNQAGQCLYQIWDTKIHYIHLHYIYILFLILIFSGLYYCEPGTNWNYIDALFMATTGSTDTGLNTIPMSDMSTYHMVLLYLSAFLGNHVLVSFVVVMVRRYYFSKRFEQELRYNQLRKEEYKRQKQFEKQQQDEENQERRNSSLISDSSVTTNGTMRRRLSLLSIHSTPAINSKRFSIFKGNNNKLKKGTGSFDTHTTRTEDIIVQHPHNMPNSILDNGDTNSPLEGEGYDVKHEEKLDDTQHPCDPTPNQSRRNSNATATPSFASINSSSLEQQEEEQQQDNQQTTHSAKTNTTTNQNQQITFREDTNVLRERERRKLLQNRDKDLIPLHRTDSEYQIMSQPSAKSELTKNERYRIGGTEYRALEMLARIVPIYYIGFIMSFGFFFRIYIAGSTYAQQVLATSNPTGPVDPWLFSFFMSLSAFTNLGLNNLDASMSPFQNAPAPLILAIILILVGNTAFAILLRFIIWFCYICTPQSKVMRRETFRYLLDHPRRCYTTLFPSTQTWWLLIILIAITLVELGVFLVLNYWLPVLAGISWGSRFLDGLFQSVATRNAGFSVVNLADLNPGTQLVYIVAMYISVYPVAISMRNSNVYQERALGIFKGDDDESVKFSEQELSNAPFIKLKRHPTMTSIAQGTKKLIKGPDFFVITQIQRQLTSDICWVITGIFCICALEAESIMSPSPVTMATVIYECVSAFGNVGASTGYPNTATSQAGQYRVLSKLVLITLMYRGRHRGLPASIDRSVLLPSDTLAEKEKQDEERRRNASVSLVHFPDANNNTTVGNSSSISTQHLPTSSSDHLFYTRSCTL